MKKVPKRVSERLSKTVGKFQKVLKIAKDRDINEADTVSIVTDMLSEVFGFEKYLEITSEFAVRGTYCDLALKLDGKIQYLIEVKAIGLGLKENHLRQAVEYGSRHGSQWAVLTNGECWEIYRIRFEKPVTHDLVLSFNFTELNSRKDVDQQKLFLLCKEGLKSAARDSYYERIQSVNRYKVGSLIMSDQVINLLKRELKKLSAGLKVENAEIEKMLINEVLKREVVEGEAATRAKARVRRKPTKDKVKRMKSKVETETSDKPRESFSEQLLRDAEEGDHTDN